MRQTDSLSNNTSARIMTSNNFLALTHCTLDFCNKKDIAFRSMIKGTSLSIMRLIWAASCTLMRSASVTKGDQGTWPIWPAVTSLMSETNSQQLYVHCQGHITIRLTWTFSRTGARWIWIAVAKFILWSISSLCSFTMKQKLFYIFQACGHGDRNRMGEENQKASCRSRHCPLSRRNSKL